MHKTLERFGHPETSIYDGEKWVVVVREKQVTIGSLVLICKEEATSLGEMSNGAAIELRDVCQKLEKALKLCFAPDKFNYIALMMVDPHVHFHVIPRYSSERTFEKVTAKDSGWPKHPDMTSTINVDQSWLKSIRDFLAQSWVP